MSRLMNIGQAAAAAGLSPKMIRHYEQIGLMPAGARTEAGYRQYGERDVSILRFIRQSRQLGFSMAQIAGLLGLWSDRQRPSREVKALVQSHLDRIGEQMRELAQMQSALQHLVGACHGGDDPHCAILDALAAHSVEPPTPGALGARPLRKRVAQPRARAEHRPDTSAAAGAHQHLMAWAHAHRAAPAVAHS